MSAPTDQRTADDDGAIAGPGSIAGNSAAPTPSNNHAGDPPDDHALVAQVRAGDGDAFGVLVERHADRLYQMLLQLACGDAEMAGELVQEAFVRAYERLDKFRGDSAFGTWLYRLARNRAIDVLARKRPKALSGDSLEQAADHQAPASPEPTQHMVQNETTAAVQRALAELTEEQRELILLRDFQDLDYAAIGERLDIPVGTVKSRISRARGRLREVVTTYLPEGWP